MTTREARFILSAYRPGGADAGDPSFAEALAQAGSDPELRGWFELSRAHDTRIASRLAEIPPPPGLREAVLAGARISSPARGASRIARFWPLWLGAAAAAAGLVVSVWFRAPLLARGPSPAALAAFAERDVLHGHHGGSGSATGEWQHRLASSGVPLPEAAAADYDILQQSGCRTLQFAGHDLLEVCFVRDGVDYHLYVMRGLRPEREGAGAGPPSPGFFAEQGGAVAVWSVGSVRYAVASRAGLAAIRNLF